MSNPFSTVDVDLCQNCLLLPSNRCVDGCWAWEDVKSKVIQAALKTKARGPYWGKFVKKLSETAEGT